MNEIYWYREKDTSFLKKNKELSNKLRENEGGLLINPNKILLFSNTDDLDITGKSFT